MTDRVSAQDGPPPAALVWPHRRLLHLEHCLVQVAEISEGQPTPLLWKAGLRPRDHQDQFSICRQWGYPVNRFLVEYVLTARRLFADREHPVTATIGLDRKQRSCSRHRFGSGGSLSLDSASTQDRRNQKSRRVAVDAAKTHRDTRRSSNDDGTVDNGAQTLGWLGDKTIVIHAEIVT